MADLIFPNAFVRQYSGPLDKDLVFTTTAERTSYLTNARRYPGQIVYDVEAKKVFVLNENASEWVDVFGASFTLSENLTGVTGTFSRSLSAPALSGTFFGDGSNLTGMGAGMVSALPLSGGTLTGDLIGTTAVFNSVSAIALSGTFFGDGSKLTGIVGGTANALPLSGGTLTGALSGTTAIFDSVSAVALSGTFFGDASNATNVPHYFVTCRTPSNQVGVMNTGVTPNTFTYNATGVLPIIDGVTLAVGDTVLFGGQTTATQSGPWKVVDTGSVGVSAVLERPRFFSGTVKFGMFITITEGNGFQAYTYAVIPAPAGTSDILVGTSNIFLNLCFTRGANNATNSANIFTGTQTLAVGSTTTAPLRFQAGTLLTTPVQHSVEWDGNFMYLTTSGANSARTTNVAFVSAPATSSSYGLAGQVAYDSTFFYVCTAANTWVKTPLTTSGITAGLDATKLPLSGGSLTGSLTVVGEISANSSVWASTYYGDGSKLTGISAVSLSASTFTSDLVVSLPGGKTFGRYSSGETIPATGKTPAEVIQMAISAPITPTVTLTSPSTVAFNQVNIATILNFSYGINSLGATLSAASLEWRRNNTGNWTQLAASPTSPLTHSMTDSSFNTAPFNYRYVVTDSTGASAVAILNVTPASYVAPTMSISVVAPTITSPETNLLREKGNIASTLSGSITRNSVNTTLASYVIQCKVNNGSYVDIGPATSITGSSATFSGVSHTPAGASTADTISYRIAVTDDYTTSNGTASVINLYYLVFYGPSATAPLNSSSVRALGSRAFTNSLANPFILNTGTAETKFTAAMPTPTAITLVQDLDASNATLTTNYTNNPFNINDGGGNAVAYNVYTLSIATPYSSSHRHQITRA